jgi:hypothetical protein
MTAMTPGLSRRLVVAALLAWLASGAFAQAAASAEAPRFDAVQKILVQSCAQCHEWTGARDSVMAGGRVIASDPDASPLWQRVADDSMPQTDQKLTPEQKAVIRGWIAAGAPEATAPGAAAGSVPPKGTSLEASRFLLFPSKVAFHEATGFASTACFIAAGAIGVARYLEMKNVAHPNGSEGEGDGGGEGDFSAMPGIWAGNQALRWWHVGLVATGETLYLGDAITGISMMTRGGTGAPGKHDIHRYAFFTHAALMAAQIALGFLETDALSRGLHEQSILYTGAHALVGVAIPCVMLYAGLENVLP